MGAAWLCALVVASVAAYASYVHQREFALQGGADVTSATLWLLSVDGLLLLATVGLLKPARHVSRRARSTVWMAFLLGIGVSLAANVAAAPTFAWRSILVAGWPPVALLFSVELFASHHRDREADESAQRESSRNEESVARGPRRSPGLPPKGETTAEEIMWDYYQQQTAEVRDHQSGQRRIGSDLLRGRPATIFGPGSGWRWWLSVPDRGR
ncbi:hypothetical protein GCM10023080_069610 [Streptomyces pseudoechinosporeus]